AGGGGAADGARDRDARAHHDRSAAPTGRDHRGIEDLDQDRGAEEPDATRRSALYRWGDGLHVSEGERTGDGALAGRGGSARCGAVATVLVRPGWRHPRAAARRGGGTRGQAGGAGCNGGRGRRAARHESPRRGSDDGRALPADLRWRGRRGLEWSAGRLWGGAL